MRPPYDTWAERIEANAAQVETWSFAVLGAHVTGFRERARREAIEAAVEFSRRMGVELAVQEAPSRVVMTGHQPDLYHPGIWVKNFALQRLADDSGALAIDLVVDTDGFDAVAAAVPCLTPVARRCTHVLATSAQDGCYACTPAPDEHAIEAFASEVDGMLSTLPAPALRRHFADFIRALRASAADAANLAELLTFARRRFEASARTTYLELPVTHLAETEAFSCFALDIIARAVSFADAYNAELEAYRSAVGIRSGAQPFPNLRVNNEAVELPFWLLTPEGRRAAWAYRREPGPLIGTSDGPLLAGIPGATLPPGYTLVPRALTLTLYARAFLSDLFIHGVGGGRYDQVTDGVCHRFYGVDAPAYAVVSMTMLLPLGGHAPDEPEIEEVRRRLSRLEHNPDAMLGEVEFDDAAERERAEALVREKAALVAAISGADADKKELGARIRRLNLELSVFLEPYARELAAQLEVLESQRTSAAVLTDRTYPFCLWSPQEIADKIG